MCIHIGSNGLVYILPTQFNFRLYQFRAMQMAKTNALKGRWCALFCDLKCALICRCVCWNLFMWFSQYTWNNEKIHVKQRENTRETTRKYTWNNEKIRCTNMTILLYLYFYQNLNHFTKNDNLYFLEICVQEHLIYFTEKRGVIF